MVNSDISTWEKHTDGDIVNTSETLITAGVNAGYNNIYIDSNAPIMESYVYYYDITDLINAHNYKVSFDIKMTNGFAVNYWVLIGVMCVYDNKNPYESEDNNYNIFFDSDKDRKSDNFHFDINIAINETKPYKAYITIGITNKVNNPTNRYFLLGNFSVVDLDDDSGFFETILNYMSSLYHSIIGGEDRQGINHESLWSRIGSYITDLKNSLSSWLSDIKVSFIGGTDSDGVIHKSLWENIADSLMNLFVPTEGYITEKMGELDDIAKQNLGALYQSAELSLDFIRMFFDVDDNAEAVISMPAWKFKIGEQTFQLFEGQDYSFEWVKVNTPDNLLYELYHAYIGFMYLVCVIAFIAYLRRKYDLVFGGEQK